MSTAFQNLRSPTVGSLRLPSPAVCFALASGLLIGPWIGFYLFDPFGFDSPLRDSWHHVAVLRELMAHPFSPSNPHIPTQEGSRYYTPVNVIAAVIGRGFSLTPYTLFNVMGAIGLIGLVGGCWSFGLKYFKSSWAPLLLFASLLFAWGKPSPHAGFHNYATWLSSASYPSSLAFVFGLFFWSRVIDVLGRRTNMGLFSLAAYAAIIFLTHQLSGAFMIAGAGSFILFNDEASKETRVLCLAAIGAGCLATLAWPYFSIVDLLASSSDHRWQSAFAERNRLGTALAAGMIPLAGIIGFRKASGAFRFELAVPAMVFFVAYVVLQLKGSPVAHRLPPSFILFGQLGLVWAALDSARHISGVSKRLGLVAGLSLFVLLSIAASVVPRINDLKVRAETGHTLEIAKRVGTFLPPDSVSFASDNFVYPLTSTGRRVVSIPRPEPASPSLAERQAATDQFFDWRIREAGRQQLIQRWGATHVVFIPSQIKPALAAQLRALGATQTFRPGIEVVTLDKSPGIARVNP